MTLRTRAHQIAPHNVCATSGLADILRIEGDYAAALQFYRQALTADPDHWPAVIGTGMIDYRQGNYQEAVRYLLHACSLMPTDSDALAMLSLALLHTGRPAAAEDAARSALLVNPDGKNYHLALAMSLDAQGRREEAKQEINAELAGDPQNQQAQALMRAVEQEE
jgi:Flp pilus assembly protein TadD